MNFIEGKSAFTLKRIISMTAQSCSKNLVHRVEPTLPDWKRTLQNIDACKKIFFFKSRVKFPFKKVMSGIIPEEMIQTDQINLVKEMLDNEEFWPVTTKLIQLYQASKNSKKMEQKESEDEDEQDFSEDEGKRRKRRFSKSKKKNNKSTKMSTQKHKKEEVSSEEEESEEVIDDSEDESFSLSGSRRKKRKS